MDKKDILLGNTEELNLIRQELEKELGLKENIEKHIVEKQSLEKDIVAEEMHVQNTIESTIKNERQEIISDFDKKIADKKDELKAVNAERKKTRDQEVRNRIKKETDVIKDENKKIHSTIREAFKEKKIPAFCDSTFFYSLYCTTTKKEFIIFAITTIIFIAGIPNAICWMYRGYWLFRVLIYIGVVAAFFVLYFVVYKLTRAKDKEIFEEMRPHRNKIHDNIKKIKVTIKEIKNDTDESLYNLGEFDEEISSTEKEIAKLEVEKEKALRLFEDVTIKKITDEIIADSKDKIDEMKEKSDNLSILLRDIEIKREDVSLNISLNYEPFLGKEFLTLSKIDKLIALVNEGKASTIAEAIGVMKGRS
jgi:hypothetical protein